jgi:hypothetical protein
MYSKVKVKVTLRLAVYHQSVRLGVKSLENHKQRHFFQLNSLRNILSDEKMGFSFMNMLSLCQVYVSHIWHVIENCCFYTI